MSHEHDIEAALAAEAAEGLGSQEVESPLVIPKEDLLLAIRYDCVTFFSFYLGEDLTMEVPELHEDIWQEILVLLNQACSPTAVQFQLKKLFAVPREHAKSTIAKLAVILFLKYSPLAFVLYVSKTNSIAKNALRDVMMWLGSDNEAQLFGRPKVIKSSETESVWIIKIAIRHPGMPAPRYKTCILKALGADQQVRGLLMYNKRPQIVIIDDIEDLDNTTPDQQPKLDEWFMGSLLKAFDSQRQMVLFIGNMIRKTTLLARLSKDPDWNPTVFGCLVRDKATGAIRPLWEGKHTVEGLLAEYAKYRRLGTGHVWEAEMMNLTQDDILMKDLRNVVRPIDPAPEDLEAGFIVLDPAYGDKATLANDDSGITVHARIRGLGIPCLIDSWHGKADENELFDKLLEFSYKWGLATWVIEADAAQRLYIPYFRLLMQSRKMNLGLFTILPIVTGKTAKYTRIFAFRNSVSGASYAVAESQQEIIDHLAEYSVETRHEDLIDSAAYGPITWQFHNAIITANGIQQVALLAFGDGEVKAEAVSLYESQVAAF